MDGIRHELFKDAIFPKVLDKDDCIVQEVKATKMKFIYKTWKNKVDDLDEWKNKSTHKWDGWYIQKQSNSFKWKQNVHDLLWIYCLSLKTWSTFKIYM